MRGQLGPSDLQRLLDLVSDKLAERGISGKVYIVGLAHDGRRTTDDVDGISMPPAEVAAAAREVARDEGLPDDWLNSAARAWVPPMPDSAKGEPSGTPGLDVVTAPPEHLLAMKIIAQRGKRDMDDIAILADELGATGEEDLYGITVDAYGEDMIESVHGGLDDLRLTCQGIERYLRSSGQPGRGSLPRGGPGQTRHQRGTPRGGQFRATQQQEPELEL